MPPAPRWIDHIVLRLSAAEPLYELLTERLGLPVTWPLQRSAFATFGWVGVGNTNLELWAAADDADLAPHAPPLIHGLALGTLELAQDVAEIAQRGLRCNPARSYRTLNSLGQPVLNFTNAVVQDVSGSACCIFFCEWSSVGTIFPWREQLTTPQRRQREQAALAACGGGVLGITGLAEVRFKVCDFAAAQSRWRALTKSREPRLRLSDEIECSFALADHDAIETLVFGVRSLPQARIFLSKHLLLSERSSAHELQLCRAATAQLDLRLVQR